MHPLQDSLVDRTLYEVLSVAPSKLKSRIAGIRVVLHGGPQPVRCFNHATARNLRWADLGLPQRYGFALMRIHGDPRLTASSCVGRAGWD